MIHKRNANDQAGVKNLRSEQAIRLAGDDVSTGVVVSDERASHRLAQEGAEDISCADMHPIHLT